MIKEFTNISHSAYKSIEMEDISRRLMDDLHASRKSIPDFVKQYKDISRITDFYKVGDDFLVGVNINVSANCTRILHGKPDLYNNLGALLRVKFKENVLTQRGLFRTFLLEKHDFQVNYPVIPIDHYFCYIRSKLLMGSDLMSKIRDLRTIGYSFRDMYVREIEVLEYETTIPESPHYYFYRINYYSNNANAIYNVTI